VPQDRDGRFSTELFERYQRSERALVAALAEMYVQGVSTRKVKAITEELCGHSFSASSISAINKKLDESLAQFASRRLSEAFPYLILDARYEKVREAGVIAGQAVLIAIGIDWDGRRQVLGVELANRESRSSWRDFLTGLRERCLAGVEFVVADDHAGLKAAIREMLPESAYQRCYVHFLRNALDYVPRKSLPTGLTRGWTTTAYKSCAGFTIGGTWRKPAPTSPPGSANGRRSIPGWSPGWKRTSRRR
jgi:transposase-like protein